MCGFLSAINAPVEPFDVLIQPADKLLACEAEVLPNNWNRMGWSFNSEMRVQGGQRWPQVEARGLPG
jgi:hypothetical protein